MKTSGVTFALALIGFAAMLAIIVGSRLSDQAATMLAGAACGAGVAGPLAIVIGMTLGAQRSGRDRPPAPSQPPIVVMTPPSAAPAPSAPLPTWSSLPALSQPMTAPRQYTILGEETVIDGTSSVWQQDI